MVQKLHLADGRHIYTAKHSGWRRRLRWRKGFVLLCSITLLIAATIVGTLAFLGDQTDPVENQFAYDQVSCAVNEELVGNTKSDISVLNTGTTEAYIRAEIVMTWQDSKGNVYGRAPALGTDYTMSDLGDGWISGNDGYYYCTSPVASGASTPMMFNSIVQTGNNPAEGYTLCVEILTDAIQSSPSKAVIEAWGVSVAADGTISKPGGMGN